MGFTSQILLLLPPSRGKPDDVDEVDCRTSVDTRMMFDCTAFSTALISAVKPKTNRTKNSGVTNSLVALEANDDTGAKEFHNSFIET